MTHTAESLQAWLGYLFVSELAALKSLTRGLPPAPTIINVGAGGGTSGLAFKEARPDATLITIDIQDASSPYGCLEAERHVLEAAGHHLGSGWYQIHDDSKEIGRNWGALDFHPRYHWLERDHRVLVDLVFIDGGHEYEDCKGDIEAWLPNIRPGGFMAVHDYRKGEADWSPNGERKPHPRIWSGVDQAVDELLVGKYEQVLRVETLVVFRVGR